VLQYQFNWKSLSAMAAWLLHQSGNFLYKAEHCGIPASQAASLERALVMSKA